jgi:hypothetical protein
MTSNGSSKNSTRPCPPIPIPDNARLKIKINEGQNLDPIKQHAQYPHRLHQIAWPCSYVREMRRALEQWANDLTSTHLAAQPSAPALSRNDGIFGARAALG